MDSPKMNESMSSMERMFIVAYKHMPNLWNVDHQDYNKREKRNKSYDTLLSILRTHIPDANRTNVRQKINILRSTYRKDLRKYLASKTITEDGEIVYTYQPNSWKFEALKFLNGLDKEEEDSKMFLSDGEVVIQDYIEDESLNELEEQEFEYIQEPDIDNEDVKDNSKIFVSTPIERNSKNKPKSLKRSFNSTFSSEIEIIDRECDAIGSNVACKLQRMNQTQRYYAEALINKVLMKGLKDHLSEETDLMDACYVVEQKSENND